MFQYSLTGKNGFGSWKTVPAVPVPLSVSGKTVPTVPVSGSAVRFLSHPADLNSFGTNIRWPQDKANAWKRAQENF